MRSARFVVPLVSASFLLVGAASPAQSARRGKEFPVPTAASYPSGITPGPDGNLWFTEFRAGKVGMVTPAGTVTDFPVPTPSSQPLTIAAGPDGNLWFTEQSASSVARVLDAPVPALKLKPTSGPALTVVKITGSGFGSFEKVKFSFIDSVNGTTTLGKALTDAGGHLRTKVTIPANATVGDQKIKAKGATSHLTLTVTFTVT